MHAAAQADPAARLFINEFGLIANSGRDEAKLAFTESKIQGMQARGVPIDGLGLEGHFTYDLTSMARVETVLARFAQLGVELHVTEFDHVIEDRLMVQDYLADLMTMVFSQPTAGAFILWGFWDGQHWRGNAPMYERDWTLKPAGQTWLDLVHGQWHTDETGISDTWGEWSTVGFHGTYSVSVTRNGVVTQINGELPAGGAILDVHLP